jgi:hypothetical protein
MRVAPAALALAALVSAAPAQQPPPGGRIDFKVFKSDQPVTGVYTFTGPLDGKPARLEIRDSRAEPGGLVGILIATGEEILTLSPKKEGLGYQGEVRRILVACGEDRLAVTDFLPLGGQVLLRFEAKPPTTPCPYLEGPPSTRWFLGPTTNPIQLKAAGEITSDRSREQIGLGSQLGGGAVTSSTVYVEGGTEVKFLGRARSLDGSMWIEVEALTSPAAGFEPPRGYLPADKLRVSATLTLVRAVEAPAPPAR